MAQKLTSKQLARAEYLHTLPPKLERAKTIVEQMAVLQADEAVVRSFSRMLDEIKVRSSTLGLPPVAEAAGIMAMMSRRSGNLQTKVRGLREQLASLRFHYEAALKKATTPGLADQERDEPAAG